MPKKSKGENVKIYGRVRSLMPWEPRKTSLQVCTGNRLRNKTAKTLNEYKFSKVFGIDVNNEEIYQTMVTPMISNVLQGFNAVLIAYGQTGSGKTFTMLGKPNLVRHILIVSSSHTIQKHKNRALLVYYQ